MEKSFFIRPVSMVGEVMSDLDSPRTTLHIVCGLPASGKTTYGRRLAAGLRAAFLDSDTATDLMIQAAHLAAGYDPHDRDSARYKQTYRLPVYETLFALAAENLPHTDVVLAGPFTSELAQRATWQQELEARFTGHEVVIHHQQLPEDLRIQRMLDRGAARDAAKL